jgi:glycosyltransferase involved in cell wall biosynthesis
MKKKYGKYILYVGLIRPHKNILRFIDAFNKLKKDKKIEHKLILIGKGKDGYINEIMKKIVQYSLEKEICIFEYVDMEGLINFYCGADLFVFPSLYEGFGLPPLEAMACGCPVVSSNTSSLPEVIGDAGIMFDPYSVDGLAKAMFKVIVDDGIRKDIVKKGFERVKLFSWKKMAEETIKIYNGVLK